MNVISVSGNIIAAILGAIVGEFATYFASKKIMNLNLEKENYKIQEEQKQSKKLVTNLISIVLKEEIENNKKEIEKSRILDGIKKTLDESSADTTFNYTVGSIPNLSFSLYEESKWEILKYTNEPIVMETIEVYRKLYLLKRGMTLDEGDKENNKKILKELYKTKEQISQLLNKLDRSLIE